MDCKAFCTASSYKIKSLYEFLKGRYKATMIREILHLDFGDDSHAFCFPYGSVVFWNVTGDQMSLVLGEISPFEEQSNDVETDEFTFIYGEQPKIVEDEIILPNHDALTKAAISHGIAQSVKLGTFESAIQKTYNQSKSLPEDLAKYGRISLSRNEIRKKMGQLFIERSNITLHVDALDTPEFFWEYPELEPLYVMVAKYLDLETRVEVLNHRLDVVHELFGMLGNELNHQHSSVLEWIIILLIVSEVVLTLLSDVFRVIWSGFFLFLFIFIDGPLVPYWGTFVVLHLRVPSMRWLRLKGMVFFTAVGWLSSEFAVAILGATAVWMRCPEASRPF